MKNTVILGAVGFGRELTLLHDQFNVVQDKFKFLGYYDEGYQKEIKLMIIKF